MKKKTIILLLIIICNIIPIGLTTGNPAPSPNYSYNNEWQITLQANESIIFNAFSYFNRTLFNDTQKDMDFTLKAYHGNLFSYNDITAEQLNYYYYFINNTFVSRRMFSYGYYNGTSHHTENWLVEEYNTSELILNLTNLETFDIAIWFYVDIIESYDYIGGDNYDWQDYNYEWWKEPIFWYIIFFSLIFMFGIAFICKGIVDSIKKHKQNHDKTRRKTEE